jgi:hypothetical protein
MKRIIRLTESDLTRIVRRVISEQSTNNSNTPITINWKKGNKKFNITGTAPNFTTDPISMKNDMNWGLNFRNAKFTVTNNSNEEIYVTAFNSTRKSDSLLTVELVTDEGGIKLRPQETSPEFEVLSKPPHDPNEKILVYVSNTDRSKTIAKVIIPINVDLSEKYRKMTGSLGGGNQSGETTQP